MMPMRRGFGSVGIVLATLMIASGCGGGGGGGGAPLPLDQFATELVAAICHKTFTCCDATELATLDPSIVDEASCRASYGASYSMRTAQFQAEIDAGLSVYDPGAARRCLDTFAALTCAAWGGDLSLRRYPVCADVMVGTQPAGTACASTDECAGGYCGSSSTNMAATCADRVNRGESCEFAACVHGLACVSPPSGGPRTCGDPAPDGSSCAFDDDCASTFCVPDSTAGGRTCGIQTTCNGV
jgi:hypothetical protein